jgi:hypothetical protein
MISDMLEACIIVHGQQRNAGGIAHQPRHIDGVIQGAQSTSRTVGGDQNFHDETPLVKTQPYVTSMGLGLR